MSAELLHESSAPLPGTMSVPEAAAALLEDGASSSSSSSPAPEPAALDWTRALRTLFGMGVAMLEARQPRWATSERELDELAAAWAPIAQQWLGSPGGPWANALAVTALWALPRLNWKAIGGKRESQARDEAARDVGEDLAGAAAADPAVPFREAHAPPWPQGERQEFRREASGAW